uniref:Selenoprotein N n=1 Tax=Salarias fasciatus TaxID=181472 RepID=A0A672FU60_SALFA
MAADVDQRGTDGGSRSAPQDELRAPGAGSWMSRGTWSLLLVAAVPLLAFGIRSYQDAQLARRHEESVRTLGPEGVLLFSSLDSDQDCFLSPEEFRPIAQRLTGVTAPADPEEDLVHDPDGETLTVEAHMQPLLLDSMTKSRDGFLGVSHSSLSGLRSWRSPAVPSSSFPASRFRAFLPPGSGLAVGDTWWLIPSELSVFTGYLPNNRYHPPPPRGKEVLIHALLSMLHPRPFVKSRFAPQGAVACLRAASDAYYDIVFRIHAEFQLNEVPDFPFWFTPGQFTGNIVLSRDASHVRHFHLYVPNDRSLNVDMEWLYGASESSNMEVDIGYLPQMELRSSGPSLPSVITDERGDVVDVRDAAEPVHFVFEDIVWSAELSRQEAARRLELALYPFKKVSYLPFSQAFQRAEAEKKLVHSILLWGASPVLTLLNQSFISSWSLGGGFLWSGGVLASLHLADYTFPVEMMVALPNGTILHHINANVFLDQTAMRPEDEASFSFSAGFEDPSTSTYIRFLREGLERARAHRTPPE